VKLAAVDGIRRRAFLRTPEVKRRLQRVLAMKSIAKDPYCRAELRTALRAIDGSSPARS
jgi:hypothetical protein